eukprot:CAMPEP_0172074750 /NCGR_PEP_ID=MMETSP1043-20130122/15582_1 /TAXON_ID=464988 /ORGANISM="Hemiselmis andersenii, Strain CCMP441" /LENGTH=56 /DNA_ID=CAMNT_0012735439 /DNA_START=65 /DNA_END=231 /DNA_ORIENTATION=-
MTGEVATAPVASERPKRDAARKQQLINGDSKGDKEAGGKKESNMSLRAVRKIAKPR